MLQALFEGQAVWEQLHRCKQQVQTAARLRVLIDGEIEMNRLALPLLLLAISGIGGGARADMIPGTKREVMAWNLAAYDHGGRGFSHCGMYANYRSGITMHFSIFDDFTWRVGWGHDAWTLTPRQKVNLALFVDGIGPHNLTAVALSKTFAAADLPATAAVFNLMRKGYRMTVNAQGNQYAFKLDGTYAALTELVACVNRFTQNAKATAPPIVPPTPSASPSSRSVVSAEERLEATKVVANILAQGEMIGFRILTAREIRDLNDDYLSRSDVVWRAEGIFGTLRIVPKTQGVAARDIGTAVIADDVKGCKGQFVSGSVKDEKNPQVVRLFTGCQEGKESFEFRYTIIPLETGSHYLFATVSRVGAGEKSDAAVKTETLLRQAVYDVMKQ